MKSNGKGDTIKGRPYKSKQFCKSEREINEGEKPERGTKDLMRGTTEEVGRKEKGVIRPLMLKCVGD